MKKRASLTSRERRNARIAHSKMKETRDSHIRGREERGSHIHRQKGNARVRHFIAGGTIASLTIDWKTRVSHLQRNRKRAFITFWKRAEADKSVSGLVRVEEARVGPRPLPKYLPVIRLYSHISLDVICPFLSLRSTC